MNILIFTNTFSPHVGGVARSVAAFTEEYRKRGHRVLVVAPEFADMPRDEIEVVRMPAIQNFNASDFSVALPVYSGLSERLDDFQPDIVPQQDSDLQHDHAPLEMNRCVTRIKRNSFPLQGGGNRPF